MGATAFDSAIVGALFSSDAMRQVFSDQNRIALYLRIEAALARAEGRLGIIPPEAATEIDQQATIANIDFEKLRRGTELAGSPIIPLVAQLTERCSGRLGQYCHWGATSQDIADTATILQVREGLAIVEGDLRVISESLAKLARAHRDTPMAGRSMLQHAVPITLGLKVAEILSAILRHLERLAQLRPRVLVGQFSGAVGTLASLGNRGLEVQSALMKELQLAEPDIGWHTHRDRIAEVGCFLGLVTGTLGKLATDVKLMTQTEVAEVSEPIADGRGSSSTMPQKRNPVACNFILGCASIVRQNVASLLEAMVQEHERAAGAWQIEWVSLPEIFLASAGALFHTRNLLAGILVDRKRMRENLDLTGGLIVSEAVVMGLAPHLGRERAHRLVSEIARASISQKKPFIDLLTQNSEIAAHLDRAALERLIDPANYLGLSGEMVDRVLQDFAAKR